jgi:hypothetical protein
MSIRTLPAKLVHQQYVQVLMFVVLFRDIIDSVSDVLHSERPGVEF